MYFTGFCLQHTVLAVVIGIILLLIIAGVEVLVGVLGIAVKVVLAYITLIPSATEAAFTCMRE